MSTTKPRRGRPRPDHLSQYRGRVFVGAPIQMDVRDQLHEVIDRLIARFPGLSMTAIVRLGVISTLRDLETIDAAIRAEDETDASTRPTVNAADDTEGAGVT